jgi:hypothetical protein
MTKKDYIVIAAALRAVRDELKIDPAACDAHARRIAMTLALDNARFDRARFLSAAGVAEA